MTVTYISFPIQPTPVAIHFMGLDEMKENESDIVTLKRQIQNLHNQIVRMNDMIGKSVVSISQEEKHKLTIEGSLGENLKVVDTDSCSQPKHLGFADHNYLGI